ncbi:unnamed protein product [Lactuca virosa]|uniref:Zinc finger GRF-type domain-containing protein n=1 Tax=Lactuca virosa TaxID=75947 RepID=A0AAU9MM71_9ASTR|nr:unnamed protein product [Lactuca virosa]
MSSSSSSNVRLCGWGHSVGMWMTWMLKNPRRRFLGCTNYNDEYINCGFFRWIDPQLSNKWYREKMYELRAQANGEDVMLDAPPPPTLLSIFMLMKPRLKLLFKILMNMVMSLELKVVELESSSS